MAGRYSPYASDQQQYCWCCGNSYSWSDNEWKLWLWAKDLEHDNRLLSADNAGWAAKVRKLHRDIDEMHEETARLRKLLEENCIDAEKTPSAPPSPSDAS